ncbi:MAG: Ig-like domain-containing protein, partial [Cyanobacteria bacterium REEB65]|nr:Ig-like domain-containing protein [Cyanobacteria bacterium REEB65]
NLAPPAGAPLTVTFNGVSAAISTVSATAITVVVPTGATTGPVLVDSNGVPTLNNPTFWVQTGLAIGLTTPPIAGHAVPAGDVLYGQTLSFAATPSFAFAPGQDAATWGSAPIVGWQATAGGMSGSTFQAPSTFQAATVTAALGSLAATAGVTAVGVDGLTVSPTSLSLNAPPVSGTPSPDFAAATSATLSYSVASTLPFADDGVVWTVSDPTLATVSASGVVSALPGAPEGTATITATTLDPPTHSATVGLSVTIFGSAIVEVQ